MGLSMAHGHSAQRHTSHTSAAPSHMQMQGLMSAPSRPSNPYSTRSQTDYSRRATNSVQSAVPSRPAGNATSAYFATLGAAPQTLARPSLGPHTGALSSMPSYLSDRAPRRGAVAGQSDEALNDLTGGLQRLQEAAFGPTQPGSGATLAQTAGAPFDEAVLAAYVRETLSAGASHRGDVHGARSFRRRTSDRNQNPLDRTPSNVSAAGEQTCTAGTVQPAHCLTTLSSLRSALAETAAEIAALTDGHAAVS